MFTTQIGGVPFNLIGFDISLSDKPHRINSSLSITVAIIETTNMDGVCPTETQHTRHDGRGERHQASPGDRAAVARREEVPAGGGERRCGLDETVSSVA